MNTILERAPSHPLALAWLGLARGGLGQKKEPVDFLRRAVSLAPDRAGLHVQLGLALLCSGNEDEAIAELERATALRPNLAAAWLNLGEIRARRGENDAAVIAYRRTLALARNPAVADDCDHRPDSSPSSRLGMTYDQSRGIKR